MSLCMVVAMVGGGSILAGCASEAEPQGPIITSGSIVDEGGERQDVDQEALGVLSDGRTEGAVCVIEYMGNDVSFFDGDTGEEIGKVHVGVNPAAIAVSSDGRSAYVANSGSGEVVRLVFGEDARVDRVRVGTQPMAVALDEPRGLLYVADYHLNSIRVVDTALMTLVDVIDLEAKGFQNREMAPACCTSPLDGTVLEGRKPVSLAISPDGGTLYCANIGTYDVSIIDLEAREELSQLDGVIGFRDVAVTPDGAYLLLAGVGSELIESKDLIVLDAASGEKVASVPIGEDVSGVACSPDGKEVIAIAKESGTVSKVSSATWEVESSVELQPGLSDVSFDKEGGRIYVANSDSGTLSCLDFASLDSIFQVDGLADPRFLASVS